MAGSDRDPDPTFGLGCHLTWPEFRECKTKKLEQRKKWLSQVVEMAEECDYGKCPTDFCYLVNLHGYIAYNLEETQVAIKKFKEVLDNDPSNVNAMGNLCVVYRDLGRRNLLDEYSKKLNAILNCETKDINALVVARAYADRGRSVKWFTAHDDKRAFRHIRYTRRAAEFAWSSDTQERGDWLFDYGLALYIKDSYLVNFETTEERLAESFAEAVTCFYEVTRSEITMERTRALSWVFIGILVNHKRCTRSLVGVLPQGIEERYFTADDCFERAMEISDHYAVVRRVGSEYAKMKEYERAETMLTQANDKLRSWFTYRWRANMYVSMYCDATLQCNHDKNDFLEKAISDFKEAFTFENTHADHSDLGHVYYLLGRYEDALEQFGLAVRCELMLFDFFDPAVTYERWAKCLEAVKESDGARNLYTKAREKREQWRKECMVWIDESWDEEDEDEEEEQDSEAFVIEDRPGFVNILKKGMESNANNLPVTDSEYGQSSPPTSLQPAMSMQAAASDVPRPLSSIRSIARTGSRVESGAQYARGGKPTFLMSPKDRQAKKYPFDFFMCHSNKDRDWVAPFFNLLERQGLKGCLHDRDFALGKPITTNICQRIEQSYKVVFVMTPHSVRSAWCQYEVRQALMQSVKRHSIVPIMLKKCKPPQEIADLTYLVCHQGQIKINDWNRLVETLKQN